MWGPEVFIHQGTVWVLVCDIFMLEIARWVRVLHFLATWNAWGHWETRFKLRVLGFFCVLGTWVFGSSVLEACLPTYQVATTVVLCLLSLFVISVHAVLVTLGRGIYTGPCLEAWCDGCCCSASAAMWWLLNEYSAKVDKQQNSKCSPPWQVGRLLLLEKCNNRLRRRLHAVCLLPFCLFFLFSLSSSWIS